MCKSTLFNNYSFSMVFFLWRTAAFCLLLLYRNKMQHRAFRLYLFAAAALLRRCFSASAPKTALVLFKRQKGYRFNRCPWVGMYYTCNQFPNHRISHTRKIAKRLFNNKIPASQSCNLLICTISIAYPIIQYDKKGCHSCTTAHSILYCAEISNKSIKIYEAITTAISIPIYKKDIFGSIKLGISFRRNTIPAITPLINKRISEKSIILCMLTVRLCGSNPIFGVHKKKT